MSETVRLNFEFPKEEYPYLKMLCAQKGVSFKELATQLLLQAIEEYEDEMMAKKAEEIINNSSKDDWISWEEARKQAGWDV